MNRSGNGSGAGFINLDLSGRFRPDGLPINRQNPHPWYGASEAGGRTVGGEGGISESLIWFARTLSPQMGLTGLRPSSGKKDKSKSSKDKLEKKHGFYSKVKDAAAFDPQKKEAAASLSAKKTISKRKRSQQKKLKAYDLSALSDLLPELFLPELKPPKVTDIKLNCKSRQKIVQREGTQLRAVLNDQSFKTDPLAAIHRYLERTQPPPPVSQEKQTGKKKKAAKRKGGKEPSTSCQSMDI